MERGRNEHTIESEECLACIQVDRKANHYTIGGWIRVWTRIPAGSLGISDKIGTSTTDCKAFTISVARDSAPYRERGIAQTNINITVWHKRISDISKSRLKILLTGIMRDGSSRRLKSEAARSIISGYEIAPTQNKISRLVGRVPGRGCRCWIGHRTNYIGIL